MGVQSAQARGKGAGSLIYHPVPQIITLLCRECAASRRGQAVPQLFDLNSQTCCTTKEILEHRLGEALSLAQVIPGGSCVENVQRKEVLLRPLGRAGSRALSVLPGLGLGCAGLARILQSCSACRVPLRSWEQFLHPAAACSGRESHQQPKVN